MKKVLQKWNSINLAQYLIWILIRMQKEEAFFFRNLSSSIYTVKLYASSLTVCAVKISNPKNQSSLRKQTLKIEAIRKKSKRHDSHERVFLLSCKIWKSGLIFFLRITIYMHPLVFCCYAPIVCKFARMNNFSCII